MMDGELMNFPEKFEDRMKELLGDEYEEFLQCYQRPYFGGIRVNTLKISPKEFEHLSPFLLVKYHGFITVIIMKQMNSLPGIHIIMPDCIIYRNQVL